MLIELTSVSLLHFLSKEHPVVRDPYVHARFWLSEAAERLAMLEWNEANEDDLWRMAGYLSSLTLVFALQQAADEAEELNVIIRQGHP